MYVLFCGLLLYPGWLCLKRASPARSLPLRLNSNASVTNAAAACWAMWIRVESFIHFRTSFIPVELCVRQLG